jgi:hypothetical protein
MLDIVVHKISVLAVPFIAEFAQSNSCKKEPDG